VPTRLSLALMCAFCPAVFGQSAGPIPGAPFSADQVTLTRQTQVDGKTTETRESRRVYRDSAGRLWQDLTTRAGAPPDMEPVIIMITDPVERVVYALETPTRVAHRIVLPKPPGGGEAMGFGFGIPFPANAKIPEGKPDFKSEPLGTQTMQGIEVQGSRTTTTWPAEAQGGGQDLVSANEMWISKDLGMAVLIKRSDFRWGTATQQLENIQRKEPDASLFIVPLDYHIEDMAFGGPPQ
jgi:hypothetical protein